MKQGSIQVKVDLIKEKDEKKQGGIKNYGVNCFLSVIVQLLNNMDEVPKFIAGVELKPPATSGLHELFESLKKTNTGDPRSLISCFEWRKGEHQDSSQFFYELNQRLEDENDSWRAFSMETFGIIHASSEHERSLTISTEGSSTLSEALLKVEPVARLSKNVVIHINRVSSTDGRKRLESQFTLNFEEDLGGILTGRPQVYALAAIVLHAGSAQQGHYKILVKRHQWIEINDMSEWIVSPKTIENIIQANPSSNFLPTNVLFKAIEGNR